MRYFPPLPLSTPAGPISSIAVCQPSSKLPVKEETPSTAGISKTTGPCLVSYNGFI
ncbi:hypothetical protein D3C85_999060 [compost metagenome]